MLDIPANKPWAGRCVRRNLPSSLLPGALTSTIQTATCSLRLTALTACLSNAIFAVYVAACYLLALHSYTQAAFLVKHWICGMLDL